MDKRWCITSLQFQWNCRRKYKYATFQKKRGNSKKYFSLPPYSTITVARYRAVAVSQLREISQQDCTQRDSIAGNTMQRYNNPSEKGREPREILETSFSAFREGRKRNISSCNFDPRETIIFVSFKIHSSNWPPSIPAQ